MYRKFKKVVISLLAHVTPSFFFFRRDLRSEALVYNSFFFFRTAVLRKLFDIRFSYKHCNFSRVCLLVKMVSETVTRSIESKTSLGKKVLCSWTEKLSGSEINSKLNELTWIFFFTYFFYGLATTPAVSVIFHPEANENTSVSQGFQYYGKSCRLNGY